METCEADPCGTTATFVGVSAGGGNSGGGNGSDSEGSSDSDSSSEGSRNNNISAGGGSESCVDGDLGVYCPCYVATVTGEEVGAE